MKRLELIKEKVKNNKKFNEVLKEFNISFDDIRIHDISTGHLLQIGKSDIQINYFNDKKIHIITPL